MQLKTKGLTKAVVDIVQNKGTEAPFSGEYDQTDMPGSYMCRQCGLALFRAQTKFHSGCGWPSFDLAIEKCIKSLPDKDGRRTEILCARCDAHLGHVFHGEQFTEKNTRHCVNSLSLDFVPDESIQDTKEAIFAAGCFWGVESLFKKLPGVVKTEVGYCGGQAEMPTYEQVCQHNTGHFEAIRILYDPLKLSYEDLVKYFFEIHDPSQSDGQGPDIGHQYLSCIFYYDNEDKHIAESVLLKLEKLGYCASTKLLSVCPFWKAEEYHQNYYEKQGKTPYCHRYTKRFF